MVEMRRITLDVNAAQAEPLAQVIADGRFGNAGEAAGFALYLLREWVEDTDA